MRLPWRLQELSVGFEPISTTQCDIVDGMVDHPCQFACRDYNGFEATAIGVCQCAVIAGVATYLQDDVRIYMVMLEAEVCQRNEKNKKQHNLFPPCKVKGEQRQNIRKQILKD